MLLVDCDCYGPPPLRAVAAGCAHRATVDPLVLDGWPQGLCWTGGSGRVRRESQPAQSAWPLRLKKLKGPNKRSRAEDPGIDGIGLFGKLTEKGPSFFLSVWNRNHPVFLSSCSERSKKRHQKSDHNRCVRSGVPTRRLLRAEWRAILNSPPNGETETSPR